MTIVDTSVWVDHFRGRDELLDAVLQDQQALLHPFVYGELLLGGLPPHGAQARQLKRLPAAPLGSVAGVAALIAWAGLAGAGVGYVDAHLLASARLLPSGRLLTADRRLRAAAKRLGAA